MQPHHTRSILLILLTLLRLLDAHALAGTRVIAWIRFAATTRWHQGAKEAAESITRTEALAWVVRAPLKSQRERKRRKRKELIKVNNNCSLTSNKIRSCHRRSSYPLLCSSRFLTVFRAGVFLLSASIPIIAFIYSYQVSIKRRRREKKREEERREVDYDGALWKQRQRLRRREGFV